MAGEVPATGLPIPLIQVHRPVENMSIDQSVDEMIQQQQDELDQERRNMEYLCDQVKSVGLQQQPQPVDQVDDPPATFRYAYIVLADYNIGVDKFEHENVEIRWVTIQRNTLAATMTIVNNFLEDPHPKGLIIHCLQRFWQELGVKMDVVMEAMRSIVKKMSTIFTHKLVFSTSPFYPCMEKKWPQVASFNIFTRNLNLEMQMTPLGVHKSLLRKVKSLGKMCVKGDMFQEFREGSGVGKTLTHEGIEKVCKWFGQHFLKGMEKNVDHNTSLVPNDNEPECLSWTPGYKGDLMVNFIRQMGTYKGLPRHRSQYKRQEYLRNKDQRRDYLRPVLASIGRRPSTSASSSSGSSRGSYRRDSRIEEGDLADQVRLVKLERDNQDLKNVLQTLKDKGEEERRERRRGEENLTNTIQRLFSEMEWMTRDRNDLSTKLIKANQELVQMKEDRDYLSDEMNRKKKKAAE